MKKKYLSLFVVLSLLVLQVLSPMGGKAVAVSAAVGDEGVANLEYTFTGVDGASVSTSSNSGQATVLIFGDTGSAYSTSTMKSIVESEWVSRPDVRVIFAESYMASCEKVQSFADSLGCDDITFCYDDTDANPEDDVKTSEISIAMSAYFKLFHSYGAITSPLIVLIDGENQARYCLTGSQTADSIMEKLKKLVAAEPLPSYDNFEYTFTGVDGTPVSTTSTPGQATVIVFGNTACTNTKSTLAGIARSEWVSRPDIRVIFAETGHASCEEVQSFAATATYGCVDDITVCYDEGSGLNSAMWSYYGLFHSGIFMSPATVLIDGENKVRSCLTGLQYSVDIMSLMEQFVEVDAEDVTVSVKLAGIQNYDYAWNVLELVNQARTENGLPELQLDSALLSTAMQRAAEIAMYYNGSHIRPNGTRFNTASIRGTCRLENIAAGYSTPESVMEGWLTSPGHYANIMDSRVTSIGIGCFRDSNGVFYWVQYFDNETASTPSNSGQKALIKTVSIKKKYLHLHTNASSTFNETDKGTTIAMEVWQENEEFSVSGRPRISASCLSFSSSDSTVATVDEQGRITLKEPGTAVITASLKDDASVQVEQTITIRQNDPDQSSTPEETADPNQSSVSEETAGPDQSSVPEETDDPSQSNVPEQTDNPSQSDVPEQTDNPSQSNMPEQTDNPSQSSTPKPSATPGQSSTSKPSVTPSQSSAPQQTVKPNQSSTPKPSATPGQTAKPNQSSTPKPSATPSQKPVQNKIPAKNSTIRDTSGNTYQVTRSGESNGTVAYMKAKSNQAATANVPSEVTIDKITYKVTSISANAFRGNTKLTKVIIGKNVTSIGNSAFEGCTALKSIVIPSKVRSIGKNAFKNCEKLKSIQIKGNVLKTVGKNAFKGIHAKAKIKVPKKQLKAYKKLLKGKGQKKTVKITQ